MDARRLTLFRYLLSDAHLQRDLELIPKVLFALEATYRLPEPALHVHQLLLLLRTAPRTELRTTPAGLIFTRVPLMSIL